MSEPSDLAVRFQALVQSPLRAAILRHLFDRRPDAFDLNGLIQATGRLRVDVENCLRELVSFGVVCQHEGRIPRFAAEPPADPALATILQAFFQKRAAASSEDLSPAVRRFREMIGRDEKMVVVFEWIRTAAKSDIAVLILGPTGSGKEVVARMIHEMSRRNRGRFQAVNLAALPDTLFESEVFGHEKGAFTGAIERKPGKLELADGGTLFLDEIGDLSLMSQAKLLRALEERRFERVGGERTIEVDFRLISATNRPVELIIREARFREDLYYRINAFAIRLPSLRERVIDIPELARRFLARQAEAAGLPPDGREFSDDAIQALCGYPWPGNIRELESTVARAALSSTSRLICAADIEFLHTGPPDAARPRLSSLRDAERAHILSVLEAVGWNKKEASEVLEISRGTLYRKIAEYALERSGSPDVTAY